MIEYVLVTVKYSNKMTKDMELPAQVEISKVCSMLLETLQTAEPMLFSDIEQISLRYKNHSVNNGTLFENKIWDGSIVEII